MKFSWRSTFHGSWQLWWDEGRMQCAEMSSRQTGTYWYLTMAYQIAPLSLDFKTKHNNLAEAKEYAENLARVLIIGGHHNRSEL